MKILETVHIDAFHKMKFMCHTQKSMADRLGISATHVGRILKGKVNYIEDKNWPRIEKILSQFIDKKKQVKCHLTDGECPFPKGTEPTDYLYQLIKLARGIPRHKQALLVANAEEMINDLHRMEEEGEEDGEEIEHEKLAG